MTIETKIHFSTGRAGQKRLRKRDDAVTPKTAMSDRIPRVARLMALAIHFDGLIRRGLVRDYADLARLGCVTRARVTQIMNLLNLAAEIQERLLFLPGAASGRDAVAERDVREVVAHPLWKEQQDAVEIIVLKDD